MKCPICDSQLDEQRYTEEIWGSFQPVEIYHKCNKCKLYEDEYVYGNSCRCVWKRRICDEKEHRLYINFIKFLYKLGVINK